MVGRSGRAMHRRDYPRKGIVRFPGGWNARVFFVQSPADLTDVLEDLGSFRALLILCGGAGGMSNEDLHRVRPHLIEGLTPWVTRERIAILDGGTASGVMALVGEGAARYGISAPLIGVCPAAKVSWPGNPNPRAEAELEPHHSHFILTPGEEFGAESEFLYALAEVLGKQVPSLGLVINGGRITYQETLFNVRQGRPIVIFRGSGRAADVIAEAWEKGQRDDPLLKEIVLDGDISIFDVTAESPEALVALLQTKLGGLQ